jgi:hypothetical protein
VATAERRARRCDQRTRGVRRLHGLEGVGAVLVIQNRVRPVEPCAREALFMEQAAVAAPERDVVFRRELSVRDAIEHQAPSR